MKRFLGGALCLCLLLTLLAGCGTKGPLDPKNPVTLTMWHVYGSQTNSLMGDLVDEFNATTGKDNGVIISVTSVSNSDSIHTELVASAKNQPGAGEPPDLFVCYPRTAIEMGTDLLIDWNTYFSEDEKAQYVPAFMEEGVYDGKQIVFPAAKSSEVLFLNKTIFDRFSSNTGIGVDSLATWEGLFEACVRYTEWTDAQTPDIPGDGKPFFFYDTPFNYMQLGARQLGGSLFSGEQINFDDPAVKGAWDAFAGAAAMGGINLQDGYGTAQMMIGDAVAYVGSTASVIYFKDTVTYPDNTIEPLELISLPCPVFRGAEKSVVQRGVGFAALSGDKAREEASALFVRWFTEKTINTEFCVGMGYLPVKKDAYEALFAIFHTPPLWDGFAILQNDFTADMKALLLPYQESVDTNATEAADMAWLRLKEKFSR